MLSTATHVPLSDDTAVLLGELTHRVRNEYASIISRLELAAARSRSPEARVTLEETADQLHDYASVHVALQLPLACHTDLSGHLSILCRALDRSLFVKANIEFTAIEERILLLSEHCWYIALIVCELVTNAAKHAFESGSGEQHRIHVELAFDNDRLVCRVGDNGTWKQRSPRRGARIVDALAARIGGTLVRASSECGTTVALTLPLDPRLDADCRSRAWPEVA